MSAAHAKPTRGFVKQATDSNEKAVKDAESASQKPSTRNVPLAKIIMAEQSQRELTLEDVIRGSISEEDPELKYKLEELEEIIRMSKSHNDDVGIIYPPTGYLVAGSRVCLMDGGRRFLSTVYGLIHGQEQESEDGEKLVRSVEEIESLFQNNTLEVKVYPVKPSAKLRADISIISNSQRASIKLYKKLELAYTRIALLDESESLDAEFFMSKFNVKKSQAYQYLKIVSVPKEEMQPALDALKGDSKLKTLDQLHQLASETNVNKRQQLLNKIIGKGKVKKAPSKSITFKTDNLTAIKSLIDFAADKTIVAKLKQINWNSSKDVQKALNLFFIEWAKKNG